MTWLHYSIISLIFYGIWGFTLKVATKGLNAQSLLITEMAGFTVMAVLILVFMNFKFETHPKASWWAFVAGLIAAVATIALMLALSKGKTSVVVTMTALYPIITIILSLLLLKETIDLRQGVGVLLALVAIGLIAK